MRILLGLYCLCCFCCTADGQVRASDSALYITPAGIRDAIFLNYNDFRRNTPIYKEQIISKLDKDQLEFIGKVMLQEKISYVSDGVTLSIDSKNVWGYFQNNTLHINYKNEFYRVPVFGSISYLVANVVVPGVGFYDSRFGPVGASMPSTEIREFLMNYYDGIIWEFTTDKAGELLSRDTSLYEEFKKLSRKKQRERLYQYIRKYNDLHPVYYLK